MALKRFFPFFFAVDPVAYVVVRDGIPYCKFCNYTAKQKRDVGRHIEARHMDLEYICSICNVVLPTKFGLQRHVRQQHH